VPDGGVVAFAGFTKIAGWFSKNKRLVFENKRLILLKSQAYFVK
jgi:hypothetical protein